jgi:hypothetical protein
MLWLQEIAMSDSIQVNMTLEQASAVSSLLDLAVRIHMGQFNVIAEEYAHDRIKISRAGHGESATFEQIDRIRALLADLKSLGGHAPNSSFGIGSPAIDTQTHRCYEVQRTLAQVVAIATNAHAMSVDRDGLRVRYTNDPLPVAKRVTESPVSDDSNHGAHERGVRQNQQAWAAALESAAPFDKRDAQTFIELFPNFADPLPRMAASITDTDRLGWLLRRLPGNVLRKLMGAHLSDTADLDECRSKLDAQIAETMSA